MEREAFRQRMQQYKQARENNPQLKYWDWKKYADGGTIDEIPPQTTSERPITNDKIINQYENDYFSLPEAEIMQLQDAKAMIDLQEEAARRYKQYGINQHRKILE